MESHLTGFENLTASAITYPVVALFSIFTFPLVPAAKLNTPSDTHWLPFISGFLRRTAAAHKSHSEEIDRKLENRYRFNDGHPGSGQFAGTSRVGFDIVKNSPHDSIACSGRYCANLSNQSFRKGPGSTPVSTPYFLSSTLPSFMITRQGNMRSGTYFSASDVAFCGCHWQPKVGQNGLFSHTEYFCRY